MATTTGQRPPLQSTQFHQVAKIRSDNAPEAVRSSEKAHGTNVPRFFGARGRRSCAALYPVLLLLAVTAAIRLPGITRPLLGHFATKNVTYAMNARNWALGRASFWHPAMDCMAGGDRGWHLLELPVTAYAAGTAWAALGGSLEVWGRVTSLLFSMGAVGLMFALVQRWHGRAAAWGASLTLALSPSAIIFGQSFMLEMPLVFFSLASFYCLDRWASTTQRRWLLLAILSFALLLVTKIYMLALALPLCVLVWQRLSAAGRAREWSAWGTFLVGGITAMAPALLWYAHVWQVATPEQATAARVFYSIRQSATVHHWPHPLLSSPDFYRRLLDDLSGWMLTPLGLSLALAGLWNSAWRRHIAWLAAAAILVAALPSKFYELAYYDLAILPVFCVLAGLGWEIICERVKPGRIGIAMLLLVAMAFSARYAARPAFITPVEDRQVLAAAEALQARAAPGEPVATLHGAASDLLYYCDRPGWAFSVNDRQLSEKLQQARSGGARWLVAADLASINENRRTAAALAPLPVACEGDDYRIYSLEH